MATPIGNAADIGLRALWVLGHADAILAEDTRLTRPLLARFGIDRPLLAAHRHNEAGVAQAIVARLARGERVALVSDAGTPGVSDPGARIVRAALAAGCRVVPVPGPSSLTAAVSVAGLADVPLRFAGFVPAAAGERARLWTRIATDPGAWVLFEAPHRIAATARELAAALGERRVVVARELTKRFESIAAMSAVALPGWVDADGERGEYVLAIDAAPAAAAVDEELDDASRAWLEALAAELPPARAAAVVARVTGLPRERLYRHLSGRAAGAPGALPGAEEPGR